MQGIIDMSKPQRIVYVVDDDPAIRDALRWLFESVGLEVETFDSAQAFMATYEPGRPGCLVLDVRLPGMGGLDLQEKLLSRHDSLPVLLITGHADVAVAVRAMKMGAVDFLAKPFNDQILLDKVQKAIDMHRHRIKVRSARSEIDERIRQLSTRENQVMRQVVGGKSNRTIAAELGLSPKTIEVHRARVMSKMKAKSLAELVRLHLTACTHPG